MRFYSRRTRVFRRRGWWVVTFWPEWSEYFQVERESWAEAIAVACQLEQKRVELSKGAFGDADLRSES